jgi:hypothetical protein
LEVSLVDAEVTSVPIVVKEGKIVRLIVNAFLFPVL